MLMNRAHPSFIWFSRDSCGDNRVRVDAVSSQKRLGHGIKSFFSYLGLSTKSQRFLSFPPLLITHVLQFDYVNKNVTAEGS